MSPIVRRLKTFGLTKENQGDKGSGIKTKSSTFKRLTEAEVQSKRKKGLCFRCDEKFELGHCCKEKKLQALVVAEEDEDSEGLKYISAQEEEPHLDVVEISLNSIVGLTSLNTMKVKGVFEDQDVVVLIDCGATHNFIAHRVVEKLGLALKETSGYGVIMGTSLSVRGKGICKRIHLFLPNVEVIEDFLPLELGSSDVILGIQWLSTLDAMLVNWKQLTMEFKVDGQLSFIAGGSEFMQIIGFT